MHVRTSPSLSEIGSLCFLITTTITLATTTLETFALFSSVRLIFLCISVACAFYCISTNGVDSNQTFAFLVFFIITLWCLGLSILSGSIDIGYQNFLVDTCVVILGLFSLIRRDGIIVSTWGARVYLFYTLIIFAVTLFYGGMSLEFPPQFLFDYDSDRIGSRALYSQSVAFFYGLGAITAAYLWIHEKKSIYRVAWVLLSIFLWLLCLLGGGRGEALFSIIVVAVIYLYFAPKPTLAMLIPTTFLLMLFVKDWTFLEDFNTFTRFLDLGSGNYGMRDDLFRDSLVLINDNLQCLVIGCGVGFFQHYYSYEFGLYPHNIIIEMVITFGLLITLTTLILVARGMYLQFRKQVGSELFILFFFFHVLLAMKSGYLFGSWFVIIGGLYFLSVLFFSIKNRFGTNHTGSIRA